MAGAGAPHSRRGTADTAALQHIAEQLGHERAGEYGRATPGKQGMEMEEGR